MVREKNHKLTLLLPSKTVAMASNLSVTVPGPLTAKGRAASEAEPLEETDA